ncbi:hypothetical protein Tdes44962_MAKER07119 [Teratosphaeria destructans]|uniref:RING-type domain-containing protein n=1 Tax=Teratosphaeria destructans TaxID=418781 RepID=A0A9W7W675_9PEZI|nr:hypothetical protein Tdes44962_MAKER07119 [Teratosphaeria destructans]
MAAPTTLTYLDERTSRIMNHGPRTKRRFMRSCHVRLSASPGVCAICQCDLAPPLDDLTDSGDLLARNRVCAHILHVGCLQQYLQQERSADSGDPTRCPACRTPWYDTEGDLHHAWVAHKAPEYLQVPKFSLYNMYGAPSIDVHLDAKELVFAIQVAAESILTSPLPVHAALSRTAGQPDGRALVAGMIELVRNMNGVVRNLNTICEQLFCRGPKKMVGGHPETMELLEFADRVAAHSTCLYFLMHSGRQ